MYLCVLHSYHNQQRLFLYRTLTDCFDVLLTVHVSIFISVINQLGAQNFCFTISLFHVSKCYTYRCDDTGGCVMQFLTS